jgi:TPR repeat protein
MFQKRIATGFLALALSLGFAAPVAAGPFEDASAAYDRGDYTTALRLFRPLAEQGNVKGQFDFGLMYREGQGVPQDYAEAMKWLRLAADQGLAEAQGLLGVMYHEGQGVPQDYAEAVKWSLLAADRGVFQAQGVLGLMYYEGQGVPQDYVRAHMWLNLAAAHGPKEATATRDSVAAKMTPAQIAEAQKLAREWKPKSN